MKLKHDRPIKQVTKGMSDTAPYTAWVNMKAACNSPDHKQWEIAGGEGLGYVATWKTFEGFWRSMRATWTVGARLCRKDTSLSYMKGNCYWRPADGKPVLTEDTNNQFGITGLSKYTDRNGYHFWCYRWTADNHRHSKMWAWNTHGEQKAFMLATIWIRARQGY